MTRPTAPRLKCAPLLARTLLVISAFGALPAQRLAAQDLSGRWVYEESGQTAELDIRHNPATGRVSGTFSLFGQSAPLVGRSQAGSLVVERLGDVPTSAENGTMTGRLQGGTLVFTVAQPGESPVTLPMSRRGGPTAEAEPDAASASESPGADVRPSGPHGGAGDAGAASAPSARSFAGRWEAASDDGTAQEVVEIAADGGTVTGTLTVLEHGYYSRRTSVKRRLALRGTLRGGTLQLRIWDAEGSPNDAVAGSARLRGEYLVLRAGEGESGYARPGTPLVRSAEGSAAAAALARAVTGRIYSASQQAGGRGAFVGGRVRLALCGDGTVAYDASDVAATPGPLGGGVDMGGTVTRRGAWDVVLLAGAPVVRARWQGTGSSYSLTAYFRIQPDASGRSANVDGLQLPVTERC